MEIFGGWKFQHKYIPRWELTYPQPRDIWRWFSFSCLVGYVSSMECSWSEVRIPQTKKGTQQNHRKQRTAFCMGKTVVDIEKISRKWQTLLWMFRSRWILHRVDGIIYIHYSYYDQVVVSWFPIKHVINPYSSYLVTRNPAPQSGGSRDGQTSTFEGGNGTYVWSLVVHRGRRQVVVSKAKICKTLSWPLPKFSGFQFRVGSSFVIIFNHPGTRRFKMFSSLTPPWLLLA